MIWVNMFFLLCDCSDYVAGQFASLSDSYYEVLWYCLPMDQQKYFIFSITNAESHIYFEGFAIYDAIVKYLKK